MKLQYIVVSACFWLVLVVASAFWNINQMQTAQQETNLKVARSFFELIVTVRKWNAQLGGVYAPVSATLQPNPYLTISDRDLHLPDGLFLTKVNPAFMTRLIADLAQQGNEVRFHITSLKPINPGNAAEAWEAQALTAFETQAQREYFDWDGQTQTFKYMAPLITDASCLKCHEIQGYKVGDIRGGISVSRPVAPLNLWPIMLSHAVIALVGLVGIRTFGRQLARAFADLERQSQIDSLTQIHNRGSFDVYLHREFLRSRRQHSPLSVILCDVDYFKSYNDLYGHQAGDSCLRQLAAVLKETVKRPGDLAARYGGEEFVIVLPDTTAGGAHALADLVRANVEALRINHKGSQVSDHVTLSLGVATTCGELKEVALLEQADQALYQAKQAGRNMVVTAVSAAPLVATNGHVPDA